MTQAVIMRQWILYLRTVWREEIAAIEAGVPSHTNLDERKKIKEELSKRAEYINQLEKQFSEGKCFGFAVCHAAMALLGKQDWWEDALTHIYTWDGDPAKLDEEIELKNASSPTTLRKLFELAISYVVHSHSAVHEELKEFFPVEIGVTQLNAVKVAASMPTLAHLQIVKDDGTLLTVKKNETVAGHFSKEQMRLLLDEETFADNICLIHSLGHTVRVSYVGNQQWQLYNPSAVRETRNAGVLHLTGTKDQVIDAVFAAMRCQDLVVEVAAIEMDKKINLSAYLDFVLQEPASLLTPDSMVLMMLESPGTLNDIFQLAKKPEYKAKLVPVIAKMIDEGVYEDEQNLLHVMLMEAKEVLPSLLELMDQSPEGKILRSVMARKLLEKETEYHQTPLHQLASFSPEGWIALLNIATSEPHDDALIHAISQSMVMKLQKTNDMLLDFLAKSPEAYCCLLKCAAKSDAVPLRIALVKSLGEHVDHQSRMTRNILLAPQILPYLFRFITQTPESQSLRTLFSDANPDVSILRLAVSKALPVRYDDKHNVLHVMAQSSPELVMNLFKFILSDHEKANNLGYLVTALADDSEGVTGWHMITDNLPQDKQKILMKMLQDRLDYLTTPELILFAQELNRALTDQQSRFRGLCSMSHNLFKSQHYGKSEIWQSLLGKAKEILISRSDATQAPGAQEILNIKM